MKFFVTGVGGQLGHDVMNELLKRGYEGIGSDMQEACDIAAPYMSLDITDRNAVEKAITDVNPDAVIHCAAWTAVDMAEDDENVAKVRAVNAGGTKNIADVCMRLGSDLGGGVADARHIGRTLIENLNLVGQHHGIDHAPDD